MIPHPKFQLFKGSDALYYFHLRAQNGEILLQSEGYTARYNAINGIYVTKLGALMNRFEQKISRDGQHYFLVKAGNGQVVAVSETYHRQQDAENGVSAVIAIVRNAPVEDLTIVAPTYPNPKYEIFKGADHDFYFHLRAQNGEILLASEGYESKQGAKNGIQSIRDLVDRSGAHFERAESENGQYYFRIVAGNHETVAVSELYTSVAGREAGIISVINNADLAPVEDTTISSLIELPELPDAAHEMHAAATPASETLIKEGESPVKNPKFQIFEGVDNQYYFHLRAPNGEIILASEGYTEKAGAQHGVGSVQRFSTDRNNFQVRQAGNGQHYFVLRANNGLLPGQIIGVSEMYEQEESAHAGIESVMHVAPDAPVEDVTKGVRMFDNPKFQIFKGEDSEFYFHLTARNGQIILASEGYTSKAGAANGVESVRKNATERDHYERKIADNGQFYFVLKASNGQVIGDSELYTSETGRENGIRSVMANAPFAPVEDETLLDNSVMDAAA